MAFSSSTHDIAADGFYMLGLSSHDQSWFIGIRNSFYRFAILFSQGILVILAGQLEGFYGNVKIAWASIFGILSIMFLFLAFYHRWALPLPQNDKNSQSKTARKKAPTGKKRLLKYEMKTCVFPITSTYQKKALSNINQIERGDLPFQHLSHYLEVLEEYQFYHQFQFFDYSSSL